MGGITRYQRTHSRIGVLKIATLAHFGCRKRTTTERYFDQCVVLADVVADFCQHLGCVAPLVGPHSVCSVHFQPLHVVLVMLCMLCCWLPLLICQCFVYLQAVLLVVLVLCCWLPLVDGYASGPPQTSCEDLRLGTIPGAFRVEGTYSHRRCAMHGTFQAGNCTTLSGNNCSSNALCTIHVPSRQGTLLNLEVTLVLPRQGTPLSLEMTGCLISDI